MTRINFFIISWKTLLSKTFRYYKYDYQLLQVYNYKSKDSITVHIPYYAHYSIALIF
jgi:hypothetical protein